jgi:hypothetical protein
MQTLHRVGRLILGDNPAELCSALALIALLTFIFSFSTEKGVI